MINAFILAPRPTCISRFLGRFFLPPSYRPSSVAFVVAAPLIYTCSPPPFLACNAIHLDVSHTHPLPSSAARSASRYAFLRLPLYTTPFSPRLPSSACTQVPVRSWGFACRRSLRVSVSRLPPHVLLHLPSSSWHIWYLVCGYFLY